VISYVLNAVSTNKRCISPNELHKCIAMGRSATAFRCYVDLSMLNLLKLSVVFVDINGLNLRLVSMFNATSGHINDTDNRLFSLLSIAV